MDVASLVLAVILGGGGIVGAVYNWWTFRQQSKRQDKLDIRQKGLDFLDSLRRQADSAERRGDLAERDRILRDYEEQERAHRKQLELEQSVPPERLSQNE
jgi:hypothetical protein